MILRQIMLFGHGCTLACDAKCDKAWGINTRPRRTHSDNPDDYDFLSDDELGDAPVDPGTYEGDSAKPRTPNERLNKWCARECERSVIAGKSDGVKTLPDFSKPRPNKQR